MISNETELGSLEVGKAADLTILATDLRGLDPAEIEDVAVSATILGGEVRHGAL